jgi:hypothetical protein
VSLTDSEETPQQDDTLAYKADAANEDDDDREFYAATKRVAQSAETADMREHRWEVTGLFGPCSATVAEELFETLLGSVEAGFGVLDPQGTAWSLAPASDEGQFPLRLDATEALEGLSRHVVALTEERDEAAARVVAVERRAEEAEMIVAAWKVTGEQLGDELERVERRAVELERLLKRCVDTAAPYLGGELEDAARSLVDPEAQHWGQEST